MSLKDKKNLLQNTFASFLDIPKEIMLDLPKITVIGDIQLYLENHRGIIEYTKEQVRISISIGELVVTGEELVLRNILPDEIYLDGRIKTVSIVR